MRIGGIVVVAVGVAALGAGVGFNLAERSLHNQMTTDVSDFSTAAVDASKFDVPSGFKQIDSDLVKRSR